LKIGIIAKSLEGGYLGKIKDKFYNFFFSVGMAFLFFIAWIVYIIFYFVGKLFFKKLLEKFNESIENGVKNAQRGFL